MNVSSFSGNELQIIQGIFIVKSDKTVNIDINFVDRNNIYLRENLEAI
jgi:hypothetical protein